jgi:hypothetical protein
MQKELESYYTGDDTKLIVVVKNMNDIKALIIHIAQNLALHPSMRQVLSVPEFPNMLNGKKDQQQILE